MKEPCLFDKAAGAPSYWNRGASKTMATTETSQRKLSLEVWKLYPDLITAIRRKLQREISRNQELTLNKEPKRPHKLKDPTHKDFETALLLEPRTGLVYVYQTKNPLHETDDKPVFQCTLVASAQQQRRGRPCRRRHKARPAKIERIVDNSMSPHSLGLKECKECLL